MKLKSGTVNKLFFLAVTLCLPLALLAIFSQDYRVYDYFFNPDSLYLPSLYQGLFVDGYPLNSFHLNPSILLIPDILIYFPLRALTGEVIIASFGFAILQHLLIFFGVLYIFKLLFPEGSWFLAAFSSLLIILFLMGAYTVGDILFGAFSLVSTNHVGAFVMMLAGIGLTLKYLSKPSKVILFLVFILSTLSVFSDRLFILMYALPVAAILVFLFLRFRIRKYATLLVCIGASLILGIVLHNFVDGRFIHLAVLPGVTDFSKILPSFNLLMQHMWSYLTAMDVHSLIIVLSLLSWLSQLILLFSLIRKREFSSLAFFYILFSVIYIFVIFWMPVITGSYIARHILRYNISAFYLSLINVPVLIYYLSSSSKMKVAKVMFLFVMLGFVMITAPQLSKGGIKKFFDYYPDFVRELDEIAQDEELLHGVGHFWNAKPITLFSKEKVEVFHAWDSFIPYYHVTSREYYTNDDQVFNFALISGFDDKTAYRKFLSDTGRIVKNGHTEVLILPPFKFNKMNGKPYFVIADTIN